MIQGSLERGPVAVELGHNDSARDALVLGDLPKLLGLNLHAVDTGNDEEGEVDGAECGTGITRRNRWSPGYRSD